MYGPHRAPSVERPVIVAGGFSMKAVDAVNVATVTTTGGEGVGLQSSLRSTEMGNANVAAANTARNVVTA